ncbi:MAG: alpha-L-arabinofuranosidase C-terminal domain-containing protein [Acidimicrobiales bacterium]
MTARLELHIDWDRVLGAKSPMLFGYFLEHFHRQVYGGIYQPGSALSDQSGLRTDVLEAVRRLRPSAIRWPGGCFVSSYHWRDGVGPSRARSYDKAWRTEEPNTFGTDEFIAFCRAVGAEPYLCGNAGTGSPEEMSDWVEYCNLAGQSRHARMRMDNGHVDPFEVRLWSIGNENYGAWEIGAHDAAEWGRYVRETAKMMRRVDDRVTLAAAAATDLDWDLALLRAAGTELDLLAVHGYAVHGDASYLQTMAAFDHAEKKIARTERLLELAGLSERVGIAFDEWNPRFWHHPGHAARARPDQSEWDRNDDNATYTMADAVLHACFLNSALRHCRSVVITNLSPLVNTRGAIYAHDGGVVLRPTYHVCDLYASSTLPEVMDIYARGPGFPAETEDGLPVEVPWGDAVATSDRPAGRTSVAVTNLHPEEPLECNVWLPGRDLDRQAALATLSGGDLSAFNDVGHPRSVDVTNMAVSCAGDRCTVTLPPHSVNVLSLRSR